MALRRPGIRLYKNSRPSGLAWTTCTSLDYLDVQDLVQVGGCPLPDINGPISPGSPGSPGNPTGVLFLSLVRPAHRPPEAHDRRADHMIDPATTLLATVQAAIGGDEAARAWLQMAAPDLCEEILGTRAICRVSPTIDRCIRLTVRLPIP